MAAGGGRSVFRTGGRSLPDVYKRQVESPQLLESCNRVAVIDHHRRAASYIENAAFSFHESYASSASELVTELLQYLVCLLYT